MTSPLENLCGPTGSLAREAPDPKEFAALNRTGRRSLVDARRTDISPESRFLLAYQAAHSLSLSALRYRGYRAKQRYIVFQVLPHTLGLGPEVWRVLSKFHDARNLGEYEGDLNVSERMVEDLIAACDTVVAAINELPPL